MIFKDQKQLLAYTLTDGIKSSRDIGKYLQVSHQTIINWWNEWIDTGIVEKIGSQGQIKSKYSIIELVTLFGSNKEVKIE